MSKAKECAINSNILFEANCGWREKFMKRKSLLFQQSKHPLE